MGKINQEERAGKAWEVLVDYASKKRVIRYKELAEKIGIHHRPLRFVLDLIYYYCEEMDYPPLSILVVNVKGIPGFGFTNSYPNSIEFGNNSVFEYDWRDVENPFAYAMDGTSEEELVEKILSDPYSADEVWTKIKVRGKAQLIFRQALLSIYGQKCAICETGIYELLEAAHIIPWSKCSGMDKMNPRNGMLLCANHHKLFDNGYILINHSYKIELHPDLEEAKKDMEYLKELEGMKIHLPQKDEMKPSKDYLKIHKQKFYDDVE